MTLHQKDECRRQFEEWATSESLNLRRQPGQERYVSSFVNGASDGYQAAYLTQQPLINELVEAGNALYAILWKESPTATAMSEAKEKWRLASEKAGV